MIQITPIPGYNPANYGKATGINNDAISQKVIQQVYDLMMDGYGASEIHHAMVDTYHLTSQAEKFIYNKAYHLMHDVTASEEENLREKQFQRLLALYRKCKDSRDRKGELNVLAEINKLGNLYTEKIELTNNEVVFRIDGEAEEETE